MQAFVKLLSSQCVLSAAFLAQESVFFALPEQTLLLEHLPQEFINLCPKKALYRLCKSERDEWSDDQVNKMRFLSQEDLYDVAFEECCGSRFLQRSRLLEYTIASPLLLETETQNPDKLINDWMTRKIKTIEHLLDQTDNDWEQHYALQEWDEVHTVFSDLWKKT